MFTAAAPRYDLGSVLPISSINGFDVIVTNYRFDVYSIHATPSAANTVWTCPVLVPPPVLV